MFLFGHGLQRHPNKWKQFDHFEGGDKVGKRSSFSKLMLWCSKKRRSSAPPLYNLINQETLGPSFMEQHFADANMRVEAVISGI